VTTINCVILAGGLAQPGDPMYELTQGKSKALLDMNGRTMLERVVDALQDSHSIGEIVVVGLGSDLGMQFHKSVYTPPTTAVCSKTRWQASTKCANCTQKPIWCCSAPPISPP